MINATAEGMRIVASGGNLTVIFIGFTRTGKAVENELGSLASSTGGRYHGAQDGEQLARAVKLAALQCRPYDLLDASGKMEVSGQTSGLSRELPPGSYRIRVAALDQVLEEPFTIVADQTTSLAIAVEGDRFVVRR
jgi:hypothetical protein